MYKPKYIFVWRSCIRSTSLTPQSSITITEGFGSRLIPHTGWHEEHRFLSSVLISSLWHCCIFTQLWPSVSPWWEEWTQQLNSWEFEAWDIWIGNREHPSSLLPLCQPCARQWLGSKEDPIKPTFMRYVAFLSSDMEVFFFFSKQTKHSENAPLVFVIPIWPWTPRQSVNSGRTDAACVRSVIVCEFGLVFIATYFTRSNPSALPYCFLYRDFHFSSRRCCSLKQTGWWRRWQHRKDMAATHTHTLAPTQQKCSRTFEGWRELSL